jgi:hypothetical protein
MNKRSWVIYLALVIILISLGWFAFRWLNPTLIVKEDGFQEYLWTYRSLDIITQVLLMFAGALGIAALLPNEEDDA